MGFYRKPLEETVPSYIEIVSKGLDLYHNDASSSYQSSSVQVKNSDGQLTYLPTSNFALTSSNVFNGNQTINGNLYVNGDINVNTIISASTIYRSGSTKFGNTQDDMHEFTGSIYMSGSIIDPSSITFNTASVPTTLRNYTFAANTTDKTLDLRMGGDATLQLGQELYYPPIVNKSGGDLPNGCLVMFNPTDPTQGNRIAVVKCVSNGTYPADYIVGILTETIAVNQEGFATWFGYVRNVSRTELESAGLKDPAETWTEGQILYPHPTRAGGLTNVQPTAPNLKATICAITSINGVNITFLVRPHLGTTLDGLHDTIDNTTTSSYGDLLMKSGSVWTNSKTLIGDYRISGSLFVSGTTELGGNIVPKTARGATLGTVDRPFRDIFVSSGSINIASDVIGAPNTILSNISGNIFVSAGGMKLVDPASFIAATGSFQYLSGSFTHIGAQLNIGDIITTGSLKVSGSTIMIGDNTMTGNTILNGSLKVSGSQTITGSLDVRGNINVASGSEFYLAGNKLFNYGQFSDTTTQSGSANTAYAMKLNTIDYAHNVSIENGTRIKVQHTGMYNLQFGAQLANSANTNLTFDIWFAYTGSNVPNSNTQIDVNRSAGQLGRAVAAWNFVLPIKENDYVEIIWSCNTSTGLLAAAGTQTNPDRPAIPSVIATLTQVG